MHRRGHGRPEPAGVQRAPTSRAAGAAERARRELTGPSSQPSHVGGVGPARGRRSPCSSPGLPHARLLLPGPPSHGDPRWLFLLRGLPERTTRHTRRPSPGPEEDGSRVHSRPALAGPPPHSPTRKGLEGAGRMQSGQPTPALEGKALRTVSLSAHVHKRVRVLHAVARPPRAPSAQPRPCSVRPSCSWRPVGRTCPQRGGSSPQKACELIAQHSRY